MVAGKLSVVATPIGNMEDITLRALRVLAEVDYVLCEDTRVTGGLLKHHGIEAKLKRYDAHATEKVHEMVLADLEAGKHIALVSDAGTPGVSDPGVMLVARVRQEAPEVVIDAIPGASALTAAFSIAGITGNSFVFLGFAPHKKGRQTFFKAIAEEDLPVIFYESPHRIMKALESLVSYLGQNSTINHTSESEGEEDEEDEEGNSDSNVKVTVARELTKMFEEVVQGSPEEVLAYFTNHPDKVRGEFVVLIDNSN